MTAADPTLVAASTQTKTVIPDTDTYRSSGGVPFTPRPRSHAGMDKRIERIIRRALEEARAAGRDHLTQTELTVRAVRQARPDMTASDALAAVDLVRPIQA